MKIIKSILYLAIFFVFILPNAIGQGIWTQKASLASTPRYKAVGFSIGNRGYIALGKFSNNLKDLWEYDPAADTWTRKADFAGDARKGAFAFTIGNKAYVGGGDAGTAQLPNYKYDFWEYDPALDKWTQKANFAGGWSCAAVAFSIAGKGYVSMGDGFSYIKNDIWEYDPFTDIWTQKTSCPCSIRKDAAGFVINNKGYIGTGNGPGGWRDDFWEYNPSSDSWTQRANFPGGGRIDAIGFSIRNIGYLGIGLDTSNVNFGVNDDFWEYLPSADSWVQIANFGGGLEWDAISFSIGDTAYVGTGQGFYGSNLWMYSDISNKIDDQNPLINQSTNVSPNPFSNFSFMNLPEGENINIHIYNMLGEQVRKISNVFSSPVKIYRENLPEGMYIYKLFSENKLLGQGKFIISL